MKRREFLTGAIKAAAATTALAVTGKEEPERNENEIEVQDSYIKCTRCQTEIFLGTEIAGAVDAVKCPECGTINLLGDILRVRRNRVVKVAQKRDA